MPYWVVQLVAGVVATLAGKFVVNPDATPALDPFGRAVGAVLRRVQPSRGGGHHGLRPLSAWSNIWIYLVAELMRVAAAAYAFRAINPDGV